MPTAELKYVAASCNRYSNVSDCRDSDGLLAFGSARFVALWYSSVSFPPPRLRLAGLTFRDRISTRQGCTLLYRVIWEMSLRCDSSKLEERASISSVGTVRELRECGGRSIVASVRFMWSERTRRETDGRFQWESFTILTGHAHSISALTSLELPTSSGHVTEFLVVTGSSDGSIRSWKLSTDSAIPPGSSPRCAL